jgi:hypothetical protein
MDRYECPNGHTIETTIGPITHCPFCGTPVTPLTRLGGPPRPPLRLVDPTDD